MSTQVLDEEIVSIRIGSRVLEGKFLDELNGFFNERRGAKCANSNISGDLIGDKGAVGEHEIEGLADGGERGGGVGEEDVVSGTVRGERRGGFEHVIEEGVRVVESGD